MSQPYLSDDALLAQAVNAANVAIGDMRTVSGKVNVLSPDVARMNASQSGNMLTQRFDAWNMKFKQVMAKLDELNGKLNKVRAENLQRDQSASTTTR